MTTNEAGNWFVRKVAGLPLERIFRRWSHEIFLVNQSVLFFSWNSAQVSRDETCMGESETPLLGGGICHKYDASVKSGVHIYPVYPLPSPPPCEKVKCQNGIRICV